MDTAIQHPTERKKRDQLYSDQLKVLISCAVPHQKDLLPTINCFMPDGNTISETSLSRLIANRPSNKKGKLNLYALLGALVVVGALQTEEDVLAFLNEYAPRSLKMMPDGLTWQAVWQNILDKRQACLASGDQPLEDSVLPSNELNEQATTNGLAFEVLHDKRSVVYAGLLMLLLLISVALIPYLADVWVGIPANAKNSQAISGGTGGFVLPRSPHDDVSFNNEWQPFEHLFAQPSLELETMMVLVPRGAFEMSATAVEINDLYRLCLAIKRDNHLAFTCQRESLFDTLGPTSTQFIDPFWIDQYEVTRADYHQCVEAGACSPPRAPDGVFAGHIISPTSNDPVSNVDFLQATQYCAWRGARLPTEAEWEYAARGPDRLVFPWGDDMDDEQQTAFTLANHCDVNCGLAPWSVDTTRTGRWDHITTYDDGYEGTAPVGSYPDGVSWVGAHDMSGNVQEWTSSLYRDLPYDSTASETDAAPRTTDIFTIKGGAFGNSIYVGATFWRSDYIATDYAVTVGFRCAMDYEAENP